LATSAWRSGSLPPPRIVGAGQVIERFGGIPSVIYEQVSAFIFDRNDVLIRSGDVEYVLGNTEQVRLVYEESVGPIEMLWSSPSWVLGWGLRSQVDRAWTRCCCVTPRSCASSANLEPMGLLRGRRSPHRLRLKHCSI
jgi:hypothetical protein